MIRTLVVMIAVGVLSACGPGEMGPPGPTGPKGDTGAPGPAGTPGIGLQSQAFCIAQGTIGSVTVVAQHFRTDFADGSAFVNCNLYATNSTTRKDSVPMFYRASDEGNKRGSCDVFHDVDSANGLGQGMFSFDAQKGAALGSLTYEDEASQYNGLTLAMNCSQF